MNAALFAPKKFKCRQAHTAMEPANQHNRRAQRRRLPGEINKHRLRNVTSLLFISDLTQCGGINHIGITADDFAEGRFGMIRGVLVEQFGVGPVLHVSI